jgi:cytoskeletal protein RodZ
MEAKQKHKRSRFLFFTLHIFHVCISIGLVIAVVRNQLVNESRFKKLERNFDCKCNSEGKQREEVRSKSYDSISGNNINQSKDKSDATVHSLAKRTLDDQLDSREDLYNYTHTTGPSHINQSIHSNKNLKEDFMITKTTIATTTVTETKVMNDSAEETQVKETKQDNSSVYEMLTKVLGKDKMHILSCLDELKVIFDVSTD